MKHAQINQHPEAKVRVISKYQRISFKGHEYDVRPLGLQVGERVAVAESGTVKGEVCALLEGATESYEVVLKKIIKNALGFDVDAPLIPVSGAKELS